MCSVEQTDFFKSNADFVYNELQIVTKHRDGQIISSSSLGGKKTEEFSVCERKLGKT